METNTVGARFIAPASPHMQTNTETNPETDALDTSTCRTDITPVVTCPYCRSTNTEFFSLFGQQLLTEQYYCNNCRTPFEYIKDDVHVVLKG